jgi:hypothetical protein
MMVRTLRAMELLEPLTTVQLQQLAEHLKPVNYAAGSHICTQASEGGALPRATAPSGTHLGECMRRRGRQGM